MRRAGGLLALVAAALVAAQGGAQALQGGAKAASGDRLARATVAIGAVTRGFTGRAVNGCSGVLIAPDRVMTAAHCVAENTVGAVVFTYQGSDRMQQPSRVASISRRSIPFGNAPAGIDASAFHRRNLDVAVLQLQNPIGGRAPLPLAGNLSEVPSRLRLAGVGLSEQKGWGYLKTTNLRTLYVTDTGLTVAQVVGGEVCVGDSGGPVVIQGRRGLALWGVTSGIIQPEPGRNCGSTVVIAPASLVGASF